KLTNFGVFVELEPGLEGLLHISELADHKVESPEEVVKLGDEVEVKILRVDVGERKLGLSRKQLHAGTPEGGAAAAEGEGCGGRLGVRRGIAAFAFSLCFLPRGRPVEEKKKESGDASPHSKAPAAPDRYALRSPSERTGFTAHPCQGGNTMKSRRYQLAWL